MAIGRLVTESRLMRPNDEVQQKVLKATEHLLACKAAKVKLVDSGEPQVASMMSLEKEGSFMDQVKTKVKEARKNVSIGLKRGFPIFSTFGPPATFSPVDVATTDQKRPRRAASKICWTCGDP